MENSLKQTRQIRMRSFLRRNFFWLLMVGGVLALVAAYEVGRYSVYRAHPEISKAEQANAILLKVGELIQLPMGETPNMVTINDAASVKEAQPFLANAENGDVLIVYPSAQQALLYRPSTNKLIAVGPVNAEVPEPSSASLESPANATSSDDEDTL